MPRRKNGQKLHQMIVRIRKTAASHDVVWGPMTMTVHNRTTLALTDNTTNTTLELPPRLVAPDAEAVEREWPAPFGMYWVTDMNTGLAVLERVPDD